MGKKSVIQCLNCGVDVVALRPTRKFCSQKCADTHRHVPKKKISYDAPCANDGCNKIVHYFPRHVKQGKRRYCSRLCCGMANLKNKPLKCVVCNSDFYCSPSQQRDRNRKTCSVACRSKHQTILAEQRLAENPPTQGVLNRRLRYSKKMQMWRTNVFERDNYTCQECGARNGNGKAVILNADHIRPFALFPEQRFDIDNGRTLCKPCHIQTPTYGNKRIYAKNQARSS